MSRFQATAFIAVLVFLSFFGGAPTTAHAAPVDALDDPIYLVANPDLGTTLTTPWADEVSSAAAYGFTKQLGSPFTVSTTSSSGLTAVHRLFDASTKDFTEALASSARLKSLTAAGYTDQGTSFYALATASVDTQPVTRYVRKGRHRLAVAGAGADLVADGWTVDGVAFYVPATDAANLAEEVGALAPGHTYYPVPDDAVFVSSEGKDSAAGSLTAPVRTIARGLALAASGGTVVVRGGTYNESLTVTRPVTLQSYGGEAVWLDGSVPVTGWVADGKVWRKDGWTTRFDHSPTYTKGAADNTEAGWRFVDTTNYPMAAYPDQVFVDGAPLQQVKSKSLVTDGTFYLDEATSTLYLGSDPSGRAVAASNLAKAASIQAEDVTLRGIGMRRYAPSVPTMGAVTAEKPGVTFENVTMTDAATQGISVLSRNAMLRQVTVTGSGLLNIHGNYADDITFERVLSTKGNDEHFNVAPTAGGVKLGHTRGVRVYDSAFTDNYSYGFWEDCSVYDSVFAGNTFAGNTTTGLFLEISAKAIVGDNLFADNGQFGLQVNNTPHVRVWNNTFVGGEGRPVNLVQDPRRNTDPTDQAVDSRQPWPNTDMPWTLTDVEVSNNVIANPTGSANCLVCVEDYSRKNTAESMRITINGNVYARRSASQPTWLAVWSRGAVVNPYVFTTLARFSATTGQEARGREYVGTSIVEGDGRLVSSVASDADAVALPLPAEVAKAIRAKSGARSLGRF